MHRCAALLSAWPAARDRDPPLSTAEGRGPGGLSGRGYEVIHELPHIQPTRSQLLVNEALVLAVAPVEPGLRENRLDRRVGGQATDRVQPLLERFEQMHQRSEHQHLAQAEPAIGMGDDHEIDPPVSIAEGLFLFVSLNNQRRHAGGSIVALER